MYHLGYLKTFPKEKVRYSRMKRRLYFHLSLTLITVIILITGAFSQTSNNAKPSGYHLTKKVEIGGEGGWDYLTVDESAHRIYLSRGSRVIVVDEDSGTAIGEIP